MVTTANNKLERIAVVNCETWNKSRGSDLVHEADDQTWLKVTFLLSPNLRAHFSGLGFSAEE